MNNDIATMAAAVGEQGAHVAPEKTLPKKAATQKKGTPKGQKTAKVGKTNRRAKAASKTVSKPGTKKDPATAREGSKKATVLELLHCKNGTTLPEIAKATKWQAHTIRGFISLLGSKGGLKIESAKNAAGARAYRIVK